MSGAPAGRNNKVAGRSLCRSAKASAAPPGG